MSFATSPVRPSPLKPRAAVSGLLLALSVVAAPLPAAAHGRGMEGGPPDDAILRAPPADAPPGVCYAHVRVPGAVVAPPQVSGAHWERRPPPPGAIGPVWCLVPNAPGAPIRLPDREGWVRVACDSGRPPPPPPPPPPRPCCTPRPELRDGWLSWHGKTYVVPAPRY